MKFQIKLLLRRAQKGVIGPRLRWKILSFHSFSLFFLEAIITKMIAVSLSLFLSNNDDFFFWIIILFTF